MDLPEEIDKTVEIGEMYVMGMDPSEIAVRTELTKRQVTFYIKQFKELQRRNMRESGTLSEQMYNILSDAEANWRRLTKEAWDLANDAKSDGDNKSVLGAWNMIERIQKNRVSAFGDTAREEDADLLRQIEEAERTHELVKTALQNIADRHPELKRELYEELAKLKDEAVVIDVEQTEDDSE